MEPLDEFQQRLGYHFQNAELLMQALTHTSYANEHAQPGNETLEFLGDSVLALAASRKLYETYPQAREGELTKWRATMINESALANVGRQMDLGPLVRLGVGEVRSKGAEKARILADAVEAIFGAVYLDSGWTEAESLVLRWIAVPSAVDAADAKSRLQEWAQKKFGLVPVYAVTVESGPMHAREFAVEVAVDGKTMGSGSGRSKKEAELAAAAQALKEVEHA